MPGRTASAIPDEIKDHRRLAKKSAAGWEEHSYMTLWYVSLWCLILGTVLLAAGYILKELYRHRDTWKGHTIGKVVELVLHPARNPQGQFRESFYPVIEYYAKGHLYRVEAEEGTWPSIYEINQELPIDYDPEDPAVFQISQKDFRSRLPEYLYACAITLLCAGALLFLRYALRS